MAPSPKLKIDTDRANAVRRPVDDSKAVLQRQLGIKGQKPTLNFGRMPAPEPDLGRAWASIQNSNIQRENVSPSPPTPNTGYLQSGYHIAPPPYYTTGRHADLYRTSNIPTTVSNVPTSPIYSSYKPLPEKPLQVYDDDSANEVENIIASIPSQLETGAPQKDLIRDDTKPPTYSALEAKEIAQHAVRLLNIKGVESVVDMLTEEGIQFHKPYTVATAAQSTILKTRETDVQKANAIKVSLKMKVLGMFNSHWKLDGIWREASRIPQQDVIDRGVNIAAFIGSLSKVDIIPGREVHNCLDLLLDEFIHFERLRGIHGLIMHGGDNMRDIQNKERMDLFLDKILSVDPITSRFVWAPRAESRELVEEIQEKTEDARKETSKRLSQGIMGIT